MKLFLIRRWFLIALALDLMVGISLSGWLKPLAEMASIRYAIVASVLFLMALPLKATAIGDTLRRPWAVLLASALNFGLLPLVAWGLAFLLSRDGLDILSEEMKMGMLVAAATPSTLASASVWTRRAGGNDAVSIVVTVLTNMTCFVITPLWLLAMTGVTVDSEQFQLGRMILKLGLLVVLPMTLAQIVRLAQPVRSWATARKTLLGVLAQFGVLSMIFLGSITTGLRIAGGVSGSSILFEIAVAAMAVMVVHVVILVIGIRLARWLRMSRQDQIAVGFSGSQKTLMVGLQVSLDMNASPIPMVAYHVGQLLIDTVVADRFRRRTQELRD